MVMARTVWPLSHQVLNAAHPETQTPTKRERPVNPQRCDDVARHWTKRIEPHLQDELLNKILIADFNDYTQGRWGFVFRPGTYPENTQSCDWGCAHHAMAAPATARPSQMVK